MYFIRLILPAQFFPVYLKRKKVKSALDVLLKRGTFPNPNIVGFFFFFCWILQTWRERERERGDKGGGKSVKVQGIKMTMWGTNPIATSVHITYCPAVVPTFSPSSPFFLKFLYLKTYISLCQIHFYFYFLFHNKHKQSLLHAYARVSLQVKPRGQW